MDSRFFPARLSGLLLTGVIIIFMGACKKTNADNASEQTVRAFFSTSKTYTLFNRALQRTHLDSLLGGTIPYTVFAVGDSAMSSAGYSAAGIDSGNIAVLTGILRYHVVPGAIDSGSIDLYKESMLTTTDSSYQAFLEYNNFGLFYNGIPLVSVDNRMVNGIVQGIQALAHPPQGDLVSTIAGIPELSDFSYAIAESENVINIGLYYSTIVPYISGTSAAPITIFLPDNNAFSATGLDDYNAILQAGSLPQALMTQGDDFTSDFLGENAINVYQGTHQTGDQLWFSIDGSSFVVAQSDIYNASFQGHYRIVRSNIITTNGVIHIIESY